MDRLIPVVFWIIQKSVSQTEVQIVQRAWTFVT